jgi:hypothetical protein
MAILIGTDEAGYGPNLGPLVISATAWRVSDEAIGCDLYETLERCVSNEAPREDGDPRVAIADSKKLYQPGAGLAELERGVLAALRTVGIAAPCWREIWTALDPSCAAPVIPWHGDYNADLPCAVERASLDKAARLLATELAAARVELLGIRSLVIFPERFNQLLDEHENKASALSYCTLSLVRDLLADHDGEPALVVCDKHGGRNRYAGLLQHFFPELLVEARREGRALSIYRWGPPECRTEARFAAGGESFLPSALASMTSKYLRELAMTAFNDFWRRRIPDLRPTAGYPTDAHRFRKEIAAVQVEVGITDRQLWRSR